MAFLASSHKSFRSRNVSLYNLETGISSVVPQSCQQRRIKNFLAPVFGMALRWI